MKPGDLIRQTTSFHWGWFIQPTNASVMTPAGQLATVLAVDESDDSYVTVTALISRSVCRSGADLRAWTSGWSVISLAEVIHEAR